MSTEAVVAVSTSVARRLAPSASDGTGHTPASTAARGRPAWERHLSFTVTAVDATAVIATVALGVALDRTPTTVGPVLGLLLFWALCWMRTRRAGVVGSWPEDLLGVARTVGAVAATVGLVGFAAGAAGIRHWVFVFAPLAGVLAVGGRLLLRQRLRRRREAGECTYPVLAVGTIDSVAELISRTRHDPRNGWVVTGVCTPTGMGSDGRDDVLGVPVVGDLDAVAGTVRTDRYRVVSIGSAPGWTSHRLRSLAWDMQDVGADLVVDPGLLAVPGRLRLVIVDGLSMVRLTERRTMRTLRHLPAHGRSALTPPGPVGRRVDPT